MYLVFGHIIRPFNLGDVVVILCTFGLIYGLQNVVLYGCNKNFRIGSSGLILLLWHMHLISLSILLMVLRTILGVLMMGL